MFYDLIQKIRNGKSLTKKESHDVVLAMMDGSWTAFQTATFLTELHNKVETAEEIVGFAEAMREKAIPVALNGIQALDTCGTGGDRKNSFNISTVAAIVLSGCGIPVVKHGNRAASSACGSADLLHAMGIRFRLNTQEVIASLEAACFAFVFAPDYHPATRSVVAVRKQLGTPTIFNLLGPLTNPALPSAQTIGVYDPGALPVMTEAIRQMDPEKRAYLIHSIHGYDEATPTAEFLLHSTFTSPLVEHAGSFGFPECSSDDLRGGSPAENASIAHRILTGEFGPKRDTVLLNAVIGYLAYVPGGSVDEAKHAVTRSIDSGSALRVVSKLQEMFPA